MSSIFDFEDHVEGPQLVVITQILKYPSSTHRLIVLIVIRNTYPTHTVY